MNAAALALCLVISAVQPAPAATENAEPGDFSAETFRTLMVTAGPGAVLPPLVVIVPWLQWRALEEKGMQPARRTAVLAASYGTLIPVMLVSFVAWTTVAGTFAAGQLFPTLEQQFPGLPGISLVLLGLLTGLVIGAHVLAVLVLEPLIVMAVLKFWK